MMLLEIKNLSPYCTPQNLKDVLVEFGTIHEMAFIKVANGQEATQTAIVQMSQDVEARSIYQFLNSDAILGYSLQINLVDSDGRGHDATGLDQESYAA
ncbi:MAG: RNA-binding protein [Bacteroidota bacterium]